jgi:hypothetical protein
LLAGQEISPVGAAAGALDVTAGALEAAAAELGELATKTLVGVQAHWYPVLEMVVVTVTEPVLPTV